MSPRVPQVTEERLQGAADVCTKAGRELVYLFGSHVTGKVWEAVDVDLDVLLGPEVGQDLCGAVRGQLIPSAKCFWP